MNDPAPGIRRRQLAIRLRELRKTSKKTHTEVASWTGFAQSTISKIENAKQEIKVAHVRLLCQCYGVDVPELDTLLRMARESNERGLYAAYGHTVPDWVRDYLDLEGDANEIWAHEPGLVFGLFQTPAYTRALSAAYRPGSTVEQLDRSVELRQARQARLFGENPPELRVALDEAVLRRIVGGSDVMAEQLAHLIEISRLPTVTLQIVPFAAPGHPSIGSGFIMLRFEDSPSMDVVYLEHDRGALYLERPTDLNRYAAMFGMITEVALNPDDSAALVDKLRVDLWEQRKGVRGG